MFSNISLYNLILQWACTKRRKTFCVMPMQWRFGHHHPKYHALIWLPGKNEWSKGMKRKAWVWITTEYRNLSENTTLNANVKRKFDKAEQNIHSLVLRWWFWFRLMTSRLLPFVSYNLFYIFYISLGSLLNTFAVNVSCAKLVTSFQADRSVEDECSVLSPTNEVAGR